MNSPKATVFNLQRFSVHDGPGIRTTVFLKGCNLRCQWCHNPESYKRTPQLRYLAKSCIHCNKCTTACPQGAIQEGKLHGECQACGLCVDACPVAALELMGRQQTPEEVFETVLKDKPYYEKSGGGMTVSGGEPLLQWEFVAALFRLAKEAGISTALDTAGCVPFERFEAVLPYTDMVLLDMKAMDNETHKQYTNQENTLILENAKKLFDRGVTVHVRVPLMAGVNDSVENACALRDFLQGHDSVAQVRLLPYHAMGVDKAQTLQMEMHTFAPPTEQRMIELKEILAPWLEQS